MSVVLATHNPKKLAELRRIIVAAGAGVDVAGLSEIEAYPEPEETQCSFEGNALLKAWACVGHSHRPALADDSGLEIDVLNGMPGVRSARWAGPECDDQANLNLVLRQLDGVPEVERTARFVCVMALVLPDGTEEVVRGVMEGTIATVPRGAHGFGYDPIFVPAGDTRTTAEMTPGEKDRISHRGQAVRAMAQVLGRMKAAGQLGAR